jgi:hypothetical protein
LNALGARVLAIEAHLEREERGRSTGPHRRLHLTGVV